MSRAEIIAGVCGFKTVVKVTANGDVCQVAIESECEGIRKLAEVLTEVNPYQEISSRRKLPKTLEMGIQYCTHAACPVPVGIIKAIEVEANLALPADVSIKLSKTDESS